MAHNDLYEAVKAGNADKVTNLIDRPGADKQIAKMYDGDSETLMTIAARSKNPKLVSILKNAGADIDKRNFSGKAPLHLSSYEGDVKMTKALLENGADINMPDDSGKMPIHWAVDRNQCQIISTLVDSGANIDAKTRSGVTILHEALGKCNEATISMIVNKNANIHALNTNNESVLLAAIKLGRADVVDVLIQSKKISLDDVTSRGESLLHLCAFAGKQSIAACLIERHNADTEFIDRVLPAGQSKIKSSSVDTEGWTSLHIVCALGLVKFVQYLLEKGASKTVKTAKGKTPANIAKDFKQEKVVALFGGKPDGKTSSARRAAAKPMDKTGSTSRQWKNA